MRIAEIMDNKMDDPSLKEKIQQVQSLLLLLLI